MLGKFCLVFAMILVFAAAGAAQYNQGDVELGFTLYNANCITCHGPNGDSIPGINLRTGQFRRVRTDDDLNKLVQTGIPGTAMPSGRYSTAELGGLVAYVRSMKDFDATGAGNGDASRGETIFEEKGNCTGCHRVNGKGSRVAPDLSDIGADRKSVV